MIGLDGAMGEGGGQILRTALALSAVTARPFEIVNIRANRPKPGLRPQHVEAVRAAARVCSATIEGAQENSARLLFEPGPVRAGRYRFEIRTAGSACLLLQAVYLPLLFAGEPSRVEIRGGTHVNWSPCYHYLERQWAPWLGRLGIRVTLALKRAGFYPQGGGEMQARIEPVHVMHGIRCLTRGALKELALLSAVGNLPSHIAERQAKRACRRLEKSGLEPRLEIPPAVPAYGKGSFVILTAEYESGRACYSALGARGKPAEKVGEEAARAMVRFLESDAVMDEYLADQILLPLSLIPEESEYSTVCVTNHLRTNAEIIKRFIGARIEVDGALGEAGTVRVRGSLPGASAEG